VATSKGRNVWITMNLNLRTGIDSLLFIEV
jgi:hypothetical protein